MILDINVLKFMYSEEATKFFKISTLLFSVCTVDKSKLEISQNLVAFSEYMNFRKTTLEDEMFGIGYFWLEIK